MDVIWVGKWSSDIYNEAYGTLTIPLNSQLNEHHTNIRIHFGGELLNSKIVTGKLFVNKKSIGVRRAFCLDNLISLITYTVNYMDEYKIEGIYECSYPVDQGTFSVSRPLISLNNIKDKENNGCVIS